MLNLPQPGLATGILRKAWGESIDEKREAEREKTKMIGNALLQNAQKGNFTESGHAFLSANFGPEIAGTARTASDAAKKENEVQMNKMKLDMEQLGWASLNQKIKLFESFDDKSKYGESGAEFQKMLVPEIEKRAGALGININLSPALDAKTRKAEIQKAFLGKLTQEAKVISSGTPTPDQIAALESKLTQFAAEPGNKNEPAIPLIQKQIDTAKARLKAEEDKAAKIAEEDRKRQADREDKEYEMTSPDGKRTARFPTRLVGKMEAAGWKVGAASKDGSEKGEVTWTTATNNLSKRFGSQDALGNIIITKKLQDKHKLAQKKLYEFKKQGVDPLDAINRAEDYANQVESKYQEYMTAAKELRGKERKIAEDKIKAAYKKKYGYLPR